MYSQVTGIKDITSLAIIFYFKEINSVRSKPLISNYSKLLTKNRKNLV